MSIVIARNISNVLYDTAKIIADGGSDPIAVRGYTTKELLFYRATITRPTERVCMYDARKGNIFAQIAETIWTLAGSNELDWLQHYIPQCYNWSDDGATWRAGYGPRLREWPTYYWRDEHPGIGWMRGSTDQIIKVLDKLQGDPNTRQAVISLWNPAEDWVSGSKDYPCNNWLHFIIRDGKLHLNVVVRSNDLIYGFSHIDFFLWSVLQQYIASWLDIDVGTMVWNVTSMHVYERHYSMVDEIVLEGRRESYPPTLPIVMAPDTYTASPAYARNIMHNALEAMTSHSYRIDPMSFRPPAYDLYSVFEYLLKLYAIIVKEDMQDATIRNMVYELLVDVPSCDLKVAAIAFMNRRFKKHQ